MRKSKYDSTPIMQGTKAQSANDDANIDIIGQRVELSTELESLREGIQGVKRLITELNEAKVVAIETIKEFHQASKALSAATVSADNVVDSICNAICRAEKTVITTKLNIGDKDTLARHRYELITEEENLLKNHSKNMRGILATHYKDMQRYVNRQSGFYLTGRIAKWGLISFWFLYAYLCVTITILAICLHFTT